MQVQYIIKTYPCPYKVVLGTLQEIDLGWARGEFSIHSLPNGFDSTVEDVVNWLQENDVMSDDIIIVPRTYYTVA